LSLGFGATGLESCTSSADVVEVVSPEEVTVSVEVEVEVVIVASDNEDDNSISIVEITVKTFNDSQLKHTTW